MGLYNNRKEFYLIIDIFIVILEEIVHNTLQLHKHSTHLFNLHSMIELIFQNKPEPKLHIFLKLVTNLFSK